MKNWESRIAAAAGLVLLLLIGYWVVRDYVDSPKVDSKLAYTPLAGRLRGNEPEPLVTPADAPAPETSPSQTGDPDSNPQPEPAQNGEADVNSGRANAAEPSDSTPTDQSGTAAMAPPTGVEDEVVTRGVDENGVPTITRTYTQTPAGYGEPPPPLFPGKVRVLNTKYRVTDTRPDSMQILKDGLNKQ